jgi:nicotinamide-nucleotide amidase
MARGAQARFGSDLAISATGVAGPTGGSAEKPVGRVYLGLATARDVKTRQLDIGPEQPRDIIQHRSAKIALNWVRLALLALPERQPR